MIEQYVILRNAAPPTRELFLGPAAPSAAGTAVAAEVSVEVNELDRHDIPELTRDPEVSAVAPAIPMKLIHPTEREDIAAPSASGTAWGVSAVGADTSPFRGEGMVVAILDTGIDEDHPAFAGVDLVQRDFTGEGDGDRDGHGTHCAGTVFGRDVDGLRVGVAPGVERALIGKVLGEGGGSSPQIVEAIRWAVENGAHVVSMSLGIDFPGFRERLQAAGLPEELATSRALEGYRANVQLFERLAALVRAQGVFGQATVIVAAAGNESRRGENPDFEIAASPPAVAEGVISVAALGQGAQGRFTVAPFSNTGANVSGPGVAIESARAGGGLASMSGTSMATPHVAGVAALWGEKILETAPLNALHLTARLVASARTEGLANGLDHLDVGAGMVTAPQG